MADQERKGGAGSWTVDDSKQSLYFPVGMVDELAQEAQRLQRSMSWVMQRAWKHARRTIKAMPSRPKAQPLGLEAVASLPETSPPAPLRWRRGEERSP